MASPRHGVDCLAKPSQVLEQSSCSRWWKPFVIKIINATLPSAQVFQRDHSCHCITIMNLNPTHDLLLSRFQMLLSKLLQFIVLLASLISSILDAAAAENVYTVTPTTILSPNLQYINTAQLRQKTAKAVDPVASGSINSYERKTIWEDKGDVPEKLDKSKEALKQLLDRRLIKR